MNKIELRTSVLFSHLDPSISARTQGIDSSHVAGTSTSPVAYALHSTGVAVLTIDNPPVNALAPNVIQGLKDCVARAHSDPMCKGIVITGAGGKFVAGADISYLKKAQDQGVDLGSAMAKNAKLADCLESGRLPSAAAIDGITLGGGLEIAMACNVRVATPDSMFGLPELKLGIIPGLGGTQRLPRLVGVQKATEMMLTSVDIKTPEASKLGLIDTVVPTHKEAIESAVRMVVQMAEGTRDRRHSSKLEDKVSDKKMVNGVLDFARKEVQKKRPVLPHSLACIDAIRCGLLEGSSVGAIKERELFSQLLHTESAKGLVHIFLAQKAVTRVPGVTDAGLRPRKVRSIGVVGGGLMGSGIATVAMMKDIRVILKEVNEKFLQAGVDRVKANFTSRVKQGRMTEEQFERAMALLDPRLDYVGFEEVDMVIEAVIEDIGLKQSVFADLARVCSPTCILATNTSTIDISLIGEKTAAAHRIVGLHFFSPAHVMPLLEIVRSKDTSAQVLVDSLAFAQQISKTPIVVGNCIGFVANRIFFPYGCAAQLLVDAGVCPYRIDRLLKDFGFPMGPFRMNDLVGVEVAYNASKIQAQSYADRFYPVRITKMMVEGKRLGEKSGVGFYAYKNRQASEDPSLSEFIEQSRKEANIRQVPDLSDSDIVDLILFCVVNEACRVIEEGHVVRPSDIDIASVYGYSFPAFRGGILKWADHRGTSTACSRLDHFHSLFGHSLLKPCSLLAQCATRNVALEKSMAD